MSPDKQGHLFVFYIKLIVSNLKNEKRYESTDPEKMIAVRQLYYSLLKLFENPIYLGILE
ncbi:hypothetical protein CIB87_28390 (plasmid) [Priestia megaterium]|uniref:Uncharacterized protein n=1 Tax=Priestia megaterium TaxID=1404 RepID=A0AA86I6K9_PRIMG|nr:hypothetical protein CIB87_28300 [Priestia megaterium]AXI32870.1 hypothetical protein CIB87_28390 [Priestia megaterium]